LLSDKGCRSVRENCGNPPFAQIVFPDLPNPFGSVKTYFHAYCNLICVQIYGLFSYKHTFEQKNAVFNAEIFILHRFGLPLQYLTRVSNSPRSCPHSRFFSFYPCSPDTTSSLHYLFLSPLAYDVFLIEKQESKIDKSAGFSLYFEVISDRNDIFRETK